MKGLPTDAQMRAAADELGLLDADGNIPTDKRAQVARAVQIAMAETEDAAANVQSSTEFANRIRDLEIAFRDALVTSTTTSAVLGAIAAPLWRDMKGNTAQ